MRFMDSVITGLNLRNCYGKFKKNGSRYTNDTGHFLLV